MPVSIIPFAVAEPMAIPEPILAQLHDMEPDAAVRHSMDLLLEINAADTLLYERCDAEGRVSAVHAAGAQAEELLMPISVKVATDFGVIEATSRSAATLVLEGWRSGRNGSRI